MSTELIEVTKAVAEFDRVAAGIAALKQQYGKVIYNVTTSKGMTDAKAARSAIREPRYEVEKIRKAAKAPILALGKKLDTEAARITRELEQLEQPIDLAIKAEEDRKERERQEKIEAELKRQADIQSRIDKDIRGIVSGAAGRSSLDIAVMLADLEALVIDDWFKEFKQVASDAKEIALAKLNQMRAAAIAHEAEQERIKAEREELARLRADQEKRDAAERARIAEEERKAKAEREAEVKRQADALRVEQEKLAAERARIAEEERQARAIREAEEHRLASERAELERQQAEAKAARESEEKRKAEQSRLATMKPPSAQELIEVLAKHYRVPGSKVIDWLISTDFQAERAA